MNPRTPEQTRTDIQLDTAATIARAMGDDGARHEVDAPFEDLSIAPTIVDMIRENNGWARYEGNQTTWEFRDGSAIVFCGTAWDVRAASCAQHCWDGQGCTCDDEEEK